MRMTFKIVAIGGLIVFLAVVTVAVFVPSLIWKPDRTIIANPYSEVESEGRKLFYSNGCNYCHTQYVRAQDTAMGPPADGGNYVFDNPMILGSERTGPDLSYLGRKRSEAWDIRHLDNPREMSPLSIMPSFEFLSLDEKQKIIHYLFNLGDRVAAKRMIQPLPPYKFLQDPIEYSTVSINSDQPQGWSTWESANLQQGKELYVARCMTCHGDAGNGLGSYAGTLTVTPADFKQEPFRSMKDDEFFWHVSEGVQGTIMPVWKASLSEQERWNVIRYIQQIFSRPVMHDPQEGDPPSDYAGMTNPLDVSIELIDEGKAIFTRECFVCHGDAGRGSGPYREDLQPGPPDFGDGSYGNYTDADYFWRISEGVPWTAMPSWKVEYSEDDRWKLVHYIRLMFTQTEDRPDEPPEGQNFTYPEFYKTSMRFPDNASYERGKVVFIQHCAHCHGAAGDGKGWDGQYLIPQPAHFREMRNKEMKPEAQGEHLAKVTFGIQDTAMPSWGEWLPLDQRWDVLKYIMGTFMGSGMPLTESVHNEQVPANFATISSDVYKSEGYSISVDNGQEMYIQYCSTCHGENGEGMGPGTEKNLSKGPAAFPSNMSEQYIYWRTWEGVPKSPMFPYKWLLTDGQAWDITAFLLNLTGSGQGGGQ